MCFDRLSGRMPREDLMLNFLSAKSQELKAKSGFQITRDHSALSATTGSTAEARSAGR